MARPTASTASPAVLLQDSLEHRLRRGLVAIPIAGLAAHVLASLGTDNLAVILMLTGIAIVMALIGLSVDGGVWTSVAGLLFMAAVPFAIGFGVGAPVFGTMVTTTVEGARRHDWAIGFRLTDATLRSDLGGTAEVMRMVRAGRGSVPQPMAYTAVPVVGADWRPGERVSIWLVAAGGRAPDSWSLPHGAVVRTFPDERQHDAIRLIESRLRLDSHPDAIIGRWVENPEAVLLDNRIFLASVIAAASGSWVLLALLARAPKQGPRRRS